MRRMLWIMNFEPHLEDLWISSLLSLSAGDASKNTILWTRFLGSFYSQKLGNQSDVLFLMWNICFEEPYFFNYRLQCKIQISSHWTVCQGKHVEIFDLLKTQLQIILSEVMIPFIEMQCVLLFRVLYLAQLTAVSFASLT